MSERPLAFQLYDTIDTMTEDEMKVAEMFFAKMMSEGREEYGPLRISTDKRTSVQMLLEAADEMIDRDFYICAARLKAEEEAK